MQGLFEPLLEVLVGLTFLVVLWFGGYQVLHRRISIGSFVMFNTYMGMLVWPMIALGLGGEPDAARHGVARPHQPDLRRAADHRRAGRSPSPSRTCAARSSSGKSRWITAAARVLDGVDLRIPAGATVAMVGHTGSGRARS